MVPCGRIPLVVKKDKEERRKDLKVKLAFVFDQDQLVKVEKVRLELLEKEGKRLSQSALMRLAVDALYDKVCRGR